MEQKLFTDLAGRYGLITSASRPECFIKYRKAFLIDMDWMLTRCEEVDEEELSGNEADSEDDGYSDEIADKDGLLLKMVCI